MSFLEIIATVLIVLIMFAIIVVKMMIDDFKYEEKKMKLFKLYIFEDGSRVVCRSSPSSREIKSEIKKHGKIVQVVTEDDDEELNLKELNDIERSKHE